MPRASEAVPQIVALSRWFEIMREFETNEGFDGPGATRRFRDGAQNPI
jgi:hypothetical protein